MLKVAARVKSYDASLEILQHPTSKKAERLLESFESVLQHERLYTNQVKPIWRLVIFLVCTAISIASRDWH